MILTGPEITSQVSSGRIQVSPFLKQNVGPNSLDLQLASSLLVYDVGMNLHQALAGGHAPLGTVLDMGRDNPTQPLTIPEEGLVLYPGVLYLGRTIESVGSDHFVPIVEGRSSVGRLGVQVHVTAGFCDLGFKGTITLEITVVHPIRVYADRRVCQVYFLEPRGEKILYKGRYQGQTDPVASRMHINLDEPEPEVQTTSPVLDLFGTDS